MRVGVNPEKSKGEKLKHRQHRIIVPFYIPNTEGYYKQSIDVLRICIRSIAETINSEETAVSLINNGSCNAASLAARELVEEFQLDRYVDQRENRGKVESVLREARSSYESFITISDADFQFFPGWEQAVFRIYQAHPYAGVVSPVPAPHAAFHFNNFVFLSGKVKLGSVVAEHDIDLWTRGTGMTFENRSGARKEYSWKEMQYYVERKNVRACVGAGHASATYRREVFDAAPKCLVNDVFHNGLEHVYLDQPAARIGLSRLSTVKAFVYHMGNRVDVVAHDSLYDSNKGCVFSAVGEGVEKSLLRYVPSMVRGIGMRTLRKLKVF